MSIKPARASEPGNFRPASGSLKAAAAASRRKVLGMLAAEQMPLIGYHMPFPGMGYVEAAGDGFRYTPATYQMSL